MFWSKNGEVIHWNTTNKQPTKITVEKLDDQYTKICNDCGKAFTLFHSAPATPSSILQASNDYLKAFEESRNKEIANYYVYLKLFSLCCLSLPEIDIRSQLLELFSKVELKNLNDNQKLLNHLLTDSKDFLKEYKEKGGSQLIGEHLVKIRPARNVQWWRDEYILLLKRPDVSSLDKSFSDFILADEIEFDENYWVISVIYTLFITQSTTNPSQFRSFVKDFQHTDDYESILIYAIMTQEYTTIVENVLNVAADNSCFSVHFIDLINVHNNVCDNRRMQLKLAVYIHVESITGNTKYDAPRKVENGLRKYIPSYLAVLNTPNVKLGTEIMQQLYPSIGKGLSGQVIEDQNSLPQFTYSKVWAKDGIVEQIISAKQFDNDNNDEAYAATVKLLNSDFNKCDKQLKVQVLRKCGDIFNTAENIEGSVVIGLLETALFDDDLEKKSEIVQQLEDYAFNNLSKAGSLPEYVPTDL